MAAAALAPAVADAWARPAKNNLVVYCPHPIEFINTIVQEFETETGIAVEVVTAGTGELLKRIERESQSPHADVMWGGGRSSMEPCKLYFEPYESANAPFLMPRYLDAGNLYTPFTVVPTVVMYNTNLVTAAEAPRSWSDLLHPKWRGKIAFADPDKSSSSFEALVTMLFAMGEGVPRKGWGYVERFIANLDGKILGGSSAVYGGVADGEYEVGVTFEEPAANYRRHGAPVGIVYPSEGTVVEADAVAVVKGARNRDNARLFVDFVTSGRVQTKIARDLDRRPCRTDAPPATGLLDLRGFRVIPGDFKWAGTNKTALLERFAELAVQPGASGPGNKARKR